ncbi:hypothetical protein CLU83_0783 [Flavobacterium sp. 1]|uniref:hypothetical protein n=1 Tax=Flavobacterium sp. 1 TaxID=2035200 RepID=UPI000C2384BF|nr:hypothetical protein [Flavobacterium sp. 1]PJJ07598.1 hypothetical protein CLU83_0783 [Flavobacterium sp. 1]
MKYLDIENEIEKMDSILNEIAQNIYENRNNDSYYHKLQFNSNQLLDHEGYTKFVNSDGELVSIFNDLNCIKENHCLYWFELENEELANNLNLELNKYRVKNLKTVPPTNNKNKKSKVFYVGIRQGGFTKCNNLTNITGRICQHLGYYDKISTQGLQLFEYARFKNYAITIKVVEFKKFKQTKFLNIIEKLVAQKLKPLCGRH